MVNKMNPNQAKEEKRRRELEAYLKLTKRHI
jgi:hypothetical protein